MRIAALLPLVILACIRPAAAQAPDLIFADAFDLLGPGEACVADERARPAHAWTQSAATRSAPGRARPVIS
jgi:hypothetical protein